MFEYDTVHCHHTLGETQVRGGVAPLRHALARRDYIETQRRRFRRSEQGAPWTAGCFHRFAVVAREFLSAARRADAVRPQI